MAEYSIDDMMLDIQMRVPLRDIKQKIRTEAIDEFIEFCDDHFPMDIMSTYEAIEEMKCCYEQLKEKKNV